LLSAEITQPVSLTNPCTKSLHFPHLRTQAIDLYILRRVISYTDTLSATLFSIVTDDILKQLELRGNISTHLKQCSAYADDILITAQTKQTMIDTSEKFKNISLQFGLISK